MGYRAQIWLEICSLCSTLDTCGKWGEDHDLQNSYETYTTESVHITLYTKDMEMISTHSNWQLHKLEMWWIYPHSETRVCSLRCVTARKTLNLQLSGHYSVPDKVLNDSQSRLVQVGFAWRLQNVRFPVYPTPVSLTDIDSFRIKQLNQKNDSAL